MKKEQMAFSMKRFSGHRLQRGFESAIRARKEIMTPLKQITFTACTAANRSFVQLRLTEKCGKFHSHIPCAEVTEDLLFDFAPVSE
jgi:hypothetical protein